MDITKIEKWSPSSNVYDDLRSVNSSSRSKLPSRSTSTIGYINPRQMENLQVKRPTVSLILPVSTSEQMTTLDTILSIDDTKESLSVESIEKENKNHNLLFEEKDQSCVCWTVREIIQLICIALFACLIGVFAFTLIFYGFDIYWLDQSIVNNSSWWLYYNDTNLTELDYDMISTTQTIDYYDEH